MVKDLQKDFPRIKYLYNEITDIDNSRIPEFKKMVGDRGVFTLSVTYPGMHY